jgi:hypothetical protein
LLVSYNGDPLSTERIPEANVRRHMTDKYSIKNQRLIYFIIHILLFVSGSLLFAQSIDSNRRMNFNSFSQTKNLHSVIPFDKGWQLLSSGDIISENATLPVLAPISLTQITFINKFQVPDSLKEQSLLIRFSEIRGIASIKLNNILILHRLNYPSGFNIPIPTNILNINNENTLEITIRKPESPEEGIPQMVRVFNPIRHLGICGEIYLEWIPPVYFSKLSYKYQDNKLSYDYEMRVTTDRSYVNAADSKIRCEEEIISPTGEIIFKRFEYFDQKDLQKRINRTIEILRPEPWSADNPSFYIIRLRAISGTGLIASNEQNIGLIQVQIENGIFYANKIPARINGINYRTNFPIIMENESYSISQNDFYEQLKNDFIDIKNLGFNAIRFPNALPHSYCFYLADSLGLYLFAENGLWRIPEPYFRDDRLLQAAKDIADETLKRYALHPSFTAFGIGNEIPLHLPTVKKFILILKGFIEQKSTTLLYLSPINFDLVVQKPITDFYIYNKYDISLLRDFTKIENARIFKNGSSLFFGNAGFSLVTDIDENDQLEVEELQSARMQSFFRRIEGKPEIAGYFLESYQDWETNSPSRVTQNVMPDQCIYPYGLLDWEGNKRDLHRRVKQFLNGEYSLPETSLKLAKKSNFFSISVFILSILFLFIYRRDYRFRENLQRSLSHPYGFFADLRDRRIIAIVDSTIIGLYTNFLVSTILSAYFYYNRDNLLIEEYLSSVLVPLNLKFFYLQIVESPLYISLFIWFCFYIMQLTVVILLKISNLFAGEKIRFRQYLAICNWAGAPLLFLLPVSLLSYHLMYYDIYHKMFFVVLVFFFLWYNFRLGNGLRVLRTMRAYKIFILMVLTYGIALFSFATFFESKYGLLTYFKLLTEANPLF